MNTLTNSAVIVIIERNASEYIGQCIDSVLSQDYSDLGIVLVDDCSTDGTSEIILGKLKDRKNAIVVINKEKHPSIENWKDAIRKKCSNPNSVIFFVDGDDYLNTSTAISQMMECHRKYDVVWSQYVFDNGCIGYCKSLGNWKVRKGPWVSSHLMSFKKYLFDKIDDYYFNDTDGKFLVAARDQAVMFTLLEMAGRERCYFLDKALYVYRKGNPTSWHNNPQKIVLQKLCSDIVRAKTPYNLNSNLLVGEGMSVVVMASDDIAMVKRILESFYFQFPSPIEVLVVNGDSTDGVGAFVRSIPVDKYPFNIRFYNAKNGFDFLADKIETKRILLTSADQIYPSGSFNFHMLVSDTKVGRGMVRDLTIESVEYNPTVNLQELAGSSMYEVIASNFSMETKLFCDAVKGCKDLLSEDFIKKVISLGAKVELLPSCVSYRIKNSSSKKSDILPNSGPLGHLL